MQGLTFGDEDGLGPRGRIVVEVAADASDEQILELLERAAEVVDGDCEVVVTVATGARVAGGGRDRGTDAGLRPVVVAEGDCGAVTRKLLACGSVEETRGEWRDRFDPVPRNARRRR